MGRILGVLTAARAFFTPTDSPEDYLAFEAYFTLAPVATLEHVYFLIKCPFFDTALGAQTAPPRHSLLSGLPKQLEAELVGGSAVSGFSWADFLSMRLDWGAHVLLVLPLHLLSVEPLWGGAWSYLFPRAPFVLQPPSLTGVVVFELHNLRKNKCGRSYLLH